MNNGIKKFFTPTVIVTIIGWTILIIFFVAGMNSHIASENIHMSYSKQTQYFIPRPYFELFEKQMKKELENIHEELKSINEFLRK